ncbi:hypothetical protein LTS08_004559 [Lithohypha guttulata]|nr:hypothetical protein LTS08_004559 [Lithohypha guttulata]
MAHVKDLPFELLENIFLQLFLMIEEEPAPPKLPIWIPWKMCSRAEQDRQFEDLVKTYETWKIAIMQIEFETHYTPFRGSYYRLFHGDDDHYYIDGVPKKRYHALRSKAEEDEETTWIQDLPNEILENIFRQLFLIYDEDTSIAHSSTKKIRQFTQLANMCDTWRNVIGNVEFEDPFAWSPGYCYRLVESRNGSQCFLFMRRGRCWARENQNREDIAHVDAESGNDSMVRSTDGSELESLGL